MPLMLIEGHFKLFHCFFHQIKALRAAKVIISSAMLMYMYAQTGAVSKPTEIPSELFTSEQHMHVQQLSR